jgi:hypothetical protein
MGLLKFSGVMRTTTSVSPHLVKMVVIVNRLKIQETTLALVLTSLSATTARNSRSKPAMNFLVKMVEHADQDKVSVHKSFMNG